MSARGLGGVRGYGRLALGLLAGLALGPTVQASPSRHTAQQQLKAKATEEDFWDRYFREALRTQSKQVTIPAHLWILRPNKRGVLPNTPFIRYLKWRRQIDGPAAFDFYHPWWAPDFRRDARVRRQIRKPPRVSTGGEYHPRPRSRPRPGGQGTRPPVVPEPSTALIVSALFGAAAWARRRHQRLVD